jgi:formate hydrogenlyase subunit 6/NADH:ubiquinone oxidoreductase subunit I
MRFASRPALDGWGPVRGVVVEDAVPAVDLDRCFGCAVCATGRPDEAIQMVNKLGHPEVTKDQEALREAAAGR